MRNVDRFIAALVALAVTALGAIVAIEVVAAAGGADHVLVPWRRWEANLTGRPWSNGSVRLVAAGLLVVGIALLASQLLEHRPRTVRVVGGPFGSLIEVERKSLERSIGRVASGADGVDRATARLDKDRIVVRARSNRRDTTGLAGRVGQRVTAQVERLRLVPTPTVGVDVEGRDG